LELELQKSKKKNKSMNINQAWLKIKAGLNLKKYVDTCAHTFNYVLCFYIWIDFPDCFLYFKKQ